MSIVERLFSRARAERRTVVLPEAHDPRIVRAAARVAREALVHPVLLGEHAAVEATARAAGADLVGVEIEDPATSPRRSACREAAATALAGKGLGERDIDALLADPLYYAVALVRAGFAHGSLAGAAHSTADTLRAALRILGPESPGGLVSSFFLMVLREPTPSGSEALLFADCGLVPYPDERQLADIARRSVASHRALVGGEPRLAFLSFSTQASASHAAVDLVRRACDALRASAPDFVFDGPLQVDAALVPEVARGKAPGSPVAGRANILIFPNLDAGNIGYKLVERLAAARAIGPILQGLSRPANDLSRGCSEEDIVVAAVVTALQSGGAQEGEPR